MKVDNLNLLSIENDTGRHIPLRPDNWFKSDWLKKNVSLEVAFDNLERRMVQFIESAPVIVGCMAWLTNGRVLDALGTRYAASILIQKEDFLRPDAGNWSEKRIKAQYSKIKGIDMYSADTGYNTASPPEIDAIRCVGVLKQECSVPPRMHHKFLVACDVRNSIPDGEIYPEGYIPRRVWTGSLNATENGTRSLENALIIDDSVVASTFYDEWKNVLGLSEALDWFAPYVRPDFRLGT